MLGLERLAMVLFDIPDIRLFWSTDDRFLSQFDANKPIADMKFQVSPLPQDKHQLHLTCCQPFSKYPAGQRDVSFWIPDGWSENTLSELVRDAAGDLAESIELVCPAYMHACGVRADDSCRLINLHIPSTAGPATCIGSHTGAWTSELVYPVPCCWCVTTCVQDIYCGGDQQHSRMSASVQVHVSHLFYAKNAIRERMASELALELR